MTALRKPDVILWDWDNTLVDSWQTIHQCLNATFVHMGAPTQTFEYTMRNVHKSLADSFPEKFGDKWEEARAFFYQTFDKIHIEALQPLDGAADTLSHCRDAGIISALISNKRHDLLRKEVTHLAWAGYFADDAIVGAGYAEKDKPAAVHAHATLEKCPVDAETAHVWFIGDSASDLQCAVNIGAQAVLFGKDAHINDDLLKAAAPLVRVEDHTQLQACIAAL